ncbi:hypothetical protein DYU05_12130 [Mucilaginibacter terrenus]|uniref:Cell division protein ZipA n=1 Tax=Mucilaginibacter terrenus TaxID=2482727 RepID=A0A3E2NPT4_9SPHI|nr:cell division protein ZipA C-terminal FtsZ-binding domain-containing protein [Mucilaginibacter terrenus]RFZ82900.1 hypothetical protein DYU05_12130 [Mucilaginibacter terrenus]
MNAKQLIPLVFFTVTTLSCGDNHKKAPKNDYFISSESETNERVRKLGLDKASEDASYILDVRKLKIPVDKNSKNSNNKIDTNDKAPKIAELDQDIIIVLKSDTKFDGKKVWDVLQSVGLKWGDGDLFHWGNPNQNYGDDALFSVWTTTDPGYFLPESIKQGQMNPDDLVFGFSVPRSADPENVFKVMTAAVKYCQKRLGGKMLDANMHPLDELSASMNLNVLITELKSKGIVPGSTPALLSY